MSQIREGRISGAVLAQITINCTLRDWSISRPAIKIGGNNNPNLTLTYIMEGKNGSKSTIKGGKSTRNITRVMFLGTELGLGLGLRLGLGLGLVLGLGL